MLRGVGDQVRSLRRRAGLTQAELARQAEVGVSTVKGLESGQGTNLTSVVRVIRVLGRDDWLDLLDPDDEPTVSPMRLLEERSRGSAP